MRNNTHITLGASRSLVRFAKGQQHHVTLGLVALSLSGAVILVLGYFAITRNGTFSAEGSVGPLSGKVIVRGVQNNDRNQR